MGGWRLIEVFVPVVEQSSGWVWFVPVFLMALLMVHAMMEFSASLLTEHPPERSRPQPVGASELQRRLLALGGSNGPYRVVLAPDGSLALHWDVVDPTWAAQFDQVRHTLVYRARLLPDDDRHELRYFEMIRSGHVFYGLAGHRPVLASGAFFFAGPMEAVWSGRAYGLTGGFPARVLDVREFSVDTTAAKNDIRRVLGTSGWSLRPVFWSVQASGFWNRARRAIVPPVLRRMPGTRFWGAAYPLSYATVIGAIVAAVGPAEFDGRDWALLILVSVAWWAMWAFLIWLVLGSAGPRGRRARRGYR